MSDTTQMPVLAVTMPLDRWRMVLEQLANGPFRVVGPLIGDIERQCNAQLQPMSQPTNGVGQQEIEPPHMPRRMGKREDASDAR